MRILAQITVHASQENIVVGWLALSNSGKNEAKASVTGTMYMYNGKYLSRIFMNTCYYYIPEKNPYT